MNAVDGLFEVLEQRREHTAIVQSDGKRVSCQKLLGAVTIQFIRLAQQGVSPGDRVLIMLPSGAAFAAVTLAVLALGAVPVFIGPTFGEGVFRARVAAIAPSCVVCHPLLMMVDRFSASRALLRRAGIALPSLPSLESVPRRLSFADSDVYRADLASTPMERIDRSEGDEALIVFTGGTTEAPKAVRMSHGGLEHYLGQIEAAVAGIPFERFLADTPQQVLYALRLGKSAHVVRGTMSRKAKRALGLIRHGDVDSMFTSPYFALKMMETAGTHRKRLPETLRAVWLGGAPVTKHFLESFVRWTAPTTEVSALYGLTETGPICSVRARDKIGYDGVGDLVGCAVSPATVEVDTQEPGADGEVVVRGPSVFLGYVGEEARDPSSGHGTGDLGRKVEVKGVEMLELRGRVKEMIIRRGVNIYPALLEPELEHCVDHSGGKMIRSCAFVGVWDDRTQDELVYLCIEPHSRGRIDMTRINRHIQAVCGPEALPDETFVFSHIPRGGRQQKMDRAALRSACATRVRARRAS
jgi:acyl-coenzyme A synthetase/AMP-(fatty) acid ligase